MFSHSFYFREKDIEFDAIKIADLRSDWPLFIITCLMKYFPQNTSERKPFLILLNLKTFFC